MLIMPLKEKIRATTRRSTGLLRPSFTFQGNLDIIRDCGVFLYPNYDTYVGWFLVNRKERTIVRQGLGTYFVQVGGYYSGRWIQDQLCRGKIKYPNGATFWGKFNEMQMPQSEGVYYLPNRGWMTATYVRGLPLGNVEFIDKNYGEWSGTAQLVSEHIVFKKKNIFMDRASLAKANRMAARCNEEDQFKEASQRAKPICVPFNESLKPYMNLQELFETVIERKEAMRTKLSSMKSI